MVLALQHSAGNAAVSRHLMKPSHTVPVQRDCHCGGSCDTCGSKETTESRDEGLLLPVSRQVPVVPAASPCTLTGSTPVEQVIDGFKQGTPSCVDEAWGILNSRAMFDLLPLLLALKNQGQWGTITTGAGPRGGPRMELAVHTVDLKTKGSPIKTDELRDLIDRLGSSFADQRADILRFVGKYVVITVQGIDLDFSYVAGKATASCIKEIQDEIAETKLFIKEYAACGADKKHKTGDQIEDCVKASFAKQGFATSVAGQTSSTGAITITPTPVTKCQPILVRNTEIHEGVHQHHTKQLEKKHGKGTAAFDTAFNDAKDWVRDELNARNAEIKFLTEVLAALKKLEKMVK